MSSLLYNGQSKKKTTGTTSYKRPGPPTPSKNAGRLSLGGLNDPTISKSILKESCDNLPSSSKKSTPGKWGNMFASSRVKDEVWILIFFFIIFLFFLFSFLSLIFFLSGNLIFFFWLLDEFFGFFFNALSVVYNHGLNYS